MGLNGNSDSPSSRCGTMMPRESAFPSHSPFSPMLGSDPLNLQSQFLMNLIKAFIQQATGNNQPQEMQKTPVNSKTQEVPEKQSGEKPASNEPYKPDRITGSEKDTKQIPTDDNLKGRPPGDKRSADEIINDNPVLKNLGNQKDIKQEELKKRFGDWSADNKDPEARADAAFNMAKVLNSIGGMDTRNGDSRTGDGDIQGITSDGDARHGTEAGVLKDGAEQGLSMPKNSDGKYALPQTNDTHVREDGSNKDNFQWGMGEIGKVLSNIPILKSVVAPFFNNIGESKNAGDAILGGLKGLAEGAMGAARGPVGWGVTAVTDTASIIAENASGDKKDEPAPFS